MKFTKSEIQDIIICEPTIYDDERGYFMETFRQDKLEDFIGHKVNFIQDNESESSKGVLRGLHYQIPPFAQSKLVRVIKGAIMDIAVDIREGSPTFKQYMSIELNESNKKQLFIPRGFAHGFVTLSDNTIVSYKVDNYYCSNSDRGILFNDESLNIAQFNYDELIISSKDKNQPTIKEAKDIFKYGVKYY